MNTDILKDLVILNLKKRTLTNTHKFTFNGSKFMTKCVKVYDGDTVTVAFNPFNDEKYYLFSARLNGIDTPELRTKSSEEKNKAIISRDMLRNLILNKIITIDCKKFDKYGRIIADIYDEHGVNVNQWMLENNFAQPYSKL